MNRGNLLFVSAHLPSLKVPQAGQKIAYHLLKRYAERYNVYLVSFYNEIEKDYIRSSDLDFCTEQHLFEVSTSRRIRAVLANIMLPLRVSARVSRDATSQIVKLQNSIRFDAAHFEFTSAAYYLDVITPPVFTSVTEHDITFQALERKRTTSKGLLRILYGLEAFRQKKWELERLAMADEVIVLCDKDRQLLIQEGIPDQKIRVQIPAIDPKYRQIVRTDIERHSILYWGALDRAENDDAVRFFCRDMFPGILQKYPDARLYVVGANPSKEIRALASANIVVTGFVEDPLEFFRKCQIAIAPLRMGAGIKIKVLEYLEAGMPVVATSVGAEGIEHARLVIADRVAEFTRAVLKLLEENS